MTHNLTTYFSILNNFIIYNEIRPRKLFENDHEYHLHLHINNSFPVGYSRNCSSCVIGHNGFAKPVLVIVLCNMQV